MIGNVRLQGGAKSLNQLGDVMKSIIAAFVFAVMGGANAAELTISGDGNVADTKYTERYSVKPLTPYKVSFEARKESFNTLGRTVCAGLPGRNVDVPLKEHKRSQSPQSGYCPRSR